MIATLFLLAAAAQAQPARAIDPEAVEVLTGYAACIVREEPRRAAQAIVEDWDSAMIRGDTGLLEPKCLRTTRQRAILRAGGPMMKAAIANSLVRAERHTLPADLSALAPLSYRMPTPLVTVDKAGKPLPEAALQSQRQAIATKLNIIVAQQIGECLVRAKPDASRAVLMTDFGSKAEVDALQQLAPSLPGCVPAGKTLELHRATVRGGLALSYYRLAAAARGQAWTAPTAETAR